MARLSTSAAVPAKPPATWRIADCRSSASTFPRRWLRSRDAWGGIVAFYAIVHLSPDEVSRALREFHHVLRPGGLLLLGFHVGGAVVHRDELWGEPVTLDFRFFETAEIEHRLVDAGFAVEARIERQPYPDAEYPSRRAYLLARIPPG